MTAPPIPHDEDGDDVDLIAVGPREAGTELALYDTMCGAIAECARVDEAKDIRDKALALKVYWRQAQNLEAERGAANVRMRAERRVGALLKDLARAEVPNPTGRNQHEEVIGGDRPQPPQSPFAQTLDDTGISRRDATRFQALADVDEETFEEFLAGPDVPTPEGLTTFKQAREKVLDPEGIKSNLGSDLAINVCGHLRRFEAEGLFSLDYAEVVAGMIPVLRQECHRLLPQVRSCLDELEEALG